MRAELTDGSHVVLPKLCDCITHNGPHWYHDIKLWHERNRMIRDDNPYAFALEELRRLNELYDSMAQRNIVRLIPEPSDTLSDVQRARLDQHYQQIRFGAAGRIIEREKTDDQRALEKRRARMDRKSATEREARRRI